MPSLPPPPADVAVATKITPIEAYESLFECLELIGEHGGAYLAFHEKHKRLFLEMPASLKMHHAWPGGYAVHISEVVSNMIRLVQANIYPAGQAVNLGEAIIAAYIHDKDKLLIRYVRDTDGPTGPQIKKAQMEGIKFNPTNETKASLSAKIDAAVNGKPQPKDEDLPRHTFNPEFPAVDDCAAVMFLCAQHGLPGITWDVVHAVSLHHGGYSPLARSSGSHLQVSPMGLLLHASDQISAGIQRGDL